MSTSQVFLIAGRSTVSLFWDGPIRESQPSLAYSGSIISANWSNIAITLIDPIQRHGNLSLFNVRATAPKKTVNATAHHTGNRMKAATEPPIQPIIAETLLHDTRK